MELKWSDIVSENFQPNRVESDSDNELETIVINTRDELISSVVDIATVKQEKNENNCCYFLSEENLPERLLSYFQNYNIDFELTCLANIISNSCKAILYLNKLGVGKNNIYNCLDEFLRKRHDLLHDLVMSSLNLSSEQTDQSFCDTFPFMTSNRTPDRIIVDGNNVIIIETTATLNVMRGFITKGKIDEGFKSKYEKEILELQNNDYNVEYVVLIFDVKDPQNTSFMSDVKKLAGLLNTLLDEDKLLKCDLIRCIFCNYSSEITKMYSSEITNLLTERFDLPKPKLDIDFLMEEGKSKFKSYKRIGISTFVYNKVCASWPRMPLILERSMLDFEGKISPSFDHSNGKFSFLRNRNGLTYDEMMYVLKNDDKPTFSKLLIQLLEGKIFNIDRADLEFFDVVDRDIIQFNFDDELKQDTHISSGLWKQSADMKNYDHLETVDHYLNLHHSYEIPDYEEKLIDGFCEFFTDCDDISKFDEFSKRHKKMPFSHYTLTEKTIDIAVENYNANLIDINNKQDHSNILRYQKQPFLYPLCNVDKIDYIDYRQPPLKIISMINKINGGNYTRAILERIKDNFTWGSHQKEVDPVVFELSQQLKKEQNNLYQLQLSILKSEGLRKLPKVKELGGNIEVKTIATNISNISRKLSSMGSGRGLKNLSVVRLPTKGKNNPLRIEFNEEMKHYKTKKSSSVFKGVGLLNYNRLFRDFSLLKTELKSVCDKDCPDKILQNHVSSDASLLKTLKTDYMRINESRLNYLSSTNFYHSCAFVSRLCHSLAFLSQTTLSSDYVSIDNLGYDGVLLMVRGGKKVFKTKQSKLFRLIYPIHESISDWYQSSDYQTSVNIIENNGQKYLLTPWHTLDEVVMNDGITFLHKSMSYLLLSGNDDMSIAFDKCFFNVMLSYHNRRKTEELLHNVRYVCVNSISNVSRLDIMLPELAGFNYDFFQAYIRSCITNNFSTFSKKLLNFNKTDRVGKDYFKNNELYSIFDNYKIDNLEDLTMTIYSTFLMSKAPTNQALEQVKNLKGMLKTYFLHEEESDDIIEQQYKLNAKTFKGDLVGYWNELFESDFNFDPSYCNLLGKFSSDYLSNIVDKGEMNSKWLKIVNENWDSFANTKGLRGMTDDNFFNKKGFFIVYDHIIKNEVEFLKIKDILISDEDDFTKRKLINEFNLKYKDQLGCKNLDCVVFHVVDKKQRGGSREIFVMDLQTKINQQAIEKYLAYMCKLIPNEAISVPSNRRLQHIHANVFEKFKQNDLVTYNLTLDCRKWAPHSVINKFIDLILGMTSYLPDTFITHFLIFFSKMFNKKVYTREYVVDIIKSNEGFRNCVEKILIPDKKKKGYYFNMSYSWIMGIFNYLSSFMHVMNQLHLSHIILKVTNKSLAIPCYYHMNAHSDDSGGKMQVDSELTMKKTFYIYELLLKSCNHLLSDKKCNISSKYFEFLSVLYINNTLLSLLAKISGAFTFHPTDTGYCGDVNECYGKCIELISNGATFEQAYIAMKVMSHLVFRFYFNRDPSHSDYLLPPQLLGVPDAHPLLVMISGSDSDIIRLTYSEDEVFEKLNYISSALNTNLDFTTESVKPITVKPNIRLSRDLLKHAEILNLDNVDDDLLWIIKNSDIKNTGLMLYKYGLMLKDKKFTASLIDETITRRISRAYYFRSGNAIETPWGNTSYKKLKIVINTFMLNLDISELDQDLIDAVRIVNLDFERFKADNVKLTNLYELMNSEVYLFVKSLDNITYSEDCIVDSKKTIKPIHINMQKTGLPTSESFNPSNLAIWIKMPKYRWLINLGDDYKNKYQQISSYLERHGVDIESVDINWLHNLLRKLKNKYVKEYFIYSNLPHNFRDISTYRDFLGFLSHNSIKNKQILGITMPYGISMSQPLNVLFKDFMNNELMSALTFVNYCFSVINDDKLFLEINDLELNPEILGCSSKNLKDLLQELYNKWELSVDDSPVICPHIKSLISHLNGELRAAPWLKDTYYYSFVKNQKLVGNVWLGKGILFVNLPRIKLEFEILNTKIVEIKANNNNFVFKHFEVAYINSVLMNANLGLLDDLFQRIDHSKWENIAFGLDSAGNVCINQNRNLKLSFQNFKSIRFIINKATKLETSEISINKNFSYNCYNIRELYESEKCTLNVFKVEPQSMLEILTKLYDTEKNRTIVESKGEMFKQYLNMFIGTASGVEMFINVDQLFDLLQSSKIYQILANLVEKDKLSKNTIKLRKHYYPGQEGGLLHALIEYKNIENGFQFDYDRILSSEMMQLKSSQPEAFMSNLITNLKEKYSQLYNNIDKETIRRELMKISEIMETDTFHNKLLSLLTTWGYIGVMGSLEEMNFVKKKENFRTIRFRGEGNSFAKFNEQALKDFLKALAKTVKVKNYFNDMLNMRYENDFFICKNWLDFQKTLISLIHSYVLNCYNVVSKFLTHTPNIEFIKLSRTLNILTQDDEFNEILMSNMQENPMLMLIPIDKKSGNDIMIMIETMLNDFVQNHKLEGNLRYDIPVQHSHGLIQPYTMTRDLLKDTKLSFNLKNLYYHGTITKEMKNFFSSNKFFVKNDKLVNVNFSLGEYCDLSIPFNKDYFIKNKLIEGADESDEYYDISMELESTEPDIETLHEAVITQLEVNYQRRVRLRYKDYYHYMPHFEVKTFFLFNLKSRPHLLNFIRDSGTTLLIVSNCYIEELVGNTDKRIQIFTKNNVKWENKTLLDPDCLIYYIMDYDPIDTDLWETILDAKHIDKNILKTLNNMAPTNLINVEDGSLKTVSKDMSMEDKLELLKDLAEEEDEEEESIVELDQEIPKIITNLKNEGYDDDFCNFIESKLKKTEEMGFKEAINKILKNFLNSSKLMETIKMKTKGGSEKIISELDDVNKATKIFEVAEVFSVGVPSKSGYKNKSLKDPALRAEINSLYDNLVDYILSGTLSISEVEMTTIKKFSKAMRRYAMGEKKDREKKIFFLDLLHLIANDAHQSKEGNHDYIFQSIRDKLTNKIVTDDEEDEFDFTSTYSKPSGLGRIYYKW